MKHEKLIRYIEKYCSEHKMSYAQFCREINKERTFFYKLSKGTINLSLDTFIDIVNKIGISPTLALSNEITIDWYNIIAEAYAELRYLESLNQLEKQDLELALSILEIFQNKGTKKTT